MTGFSYLNEDVLISIFCFFNPLELLKLSRVCKQWNNVLSNCSILRKRHLRQYQACTLQHISNARELVKFLYEKSIELEGEYWNPDPYEPLVQRNDRLKDFFYIPNLGFYFEEGFELYLRLNTTYDIVRGCKYEQTESGKDLHNAENEVEPCVEFLSFVQNLQTSLFKEPFCA